MIEVENKRIVVLAPHTDDAEFGCGGAIHKFLHQGCEVYCFAFSSCKESLPEELDENTLIHEMAKSMSVLGVKDKNMAIYDFPVRYFSSHRQDILEELVKIRKSLNPDIVILPASCDIHQDHAVIHREGLRAFKESSILGYELPWNNFYFKNQCYIKISLDSLSKKIESIKQYESQSKKKYSTPEYIKALAISRGVQGGMKYAELFEVIRLNL